MSESTLLQPRPPATSGYGSHSSMLAPGVPLNGCLKKVVLQDDAGQYCTEQHTLDDGLADRNRYSSSQHRTTLLVTVINEYQSVWKSVIDDAREGDLQKVKDAISGIRFRVGRDETVSRCALDLKRAGLDAAAVVCAEEITDPQIQEDTIERIRAED
jgi:hypothetical protein